jgi:regulator of protease activity HflC (stomatin/prohibitin superfamily)
MILLITLLIIGLIILYLAIVIVQEGNIAVISIFGKYSRIFHPGLNFKIPIIENVYKTISIQNRSIELEFQAITIDQANVYFKSMLLYSVINQEENTIINVAYKFIDVQSLMQTIVRTVEGSIRSFVATKKQSEILSLRKEIVSYVKDQIDQVMEEWGYHLQDLQLNDITFDEVILKSMSQVVASNNLKAAAENEGQALLITKTKSAEAEGNAIKISASAEKEAAKLRGQGVALFRQEVAKGMSDAAREMQQANLDTSVILFSMWTEAIKQFGEQSNGNVIFLDGSPDNMQRTLQQMISVNQMKTQKSESPNS